MRKSYRSYAKLNLHLEVVGRRDDGFHELRTVFQTVSLHDEIEVGATAGGIDLTTSGIETPAGQDNLVYRAAAEFLSRWGSGGVGLRLTKRIPVGGGLGGGSSNAATVLMALRDLHGRPDTLDEFQSVAASLGADVPFFLVGGTAVGTERGDRIEPAPDLPAEEVWIVDPGVHVSTAAVFGAHRSERASSAAGIVDEVLAGTVERPSDAVGRNDLEATTLRLFPAVKEVYTALVQSGAERVQISGSGGSMFAFFASPPEERVLASALPVAARLFRARTVPRGVVDASRIVGSPKGG